MHLKKENKTSKICFGIFYRLLLGIMCGISWFASFDSFSIHMVFIAFSITTLLIAVIVYEVAGQKALRSWVCIFLTFCFLSGYAAGCWKLVNLKAADRKYTITETVDGIEDYSNSLAANIDSVRRLEESVWKTLNTDEKTAIFHDICKIECRFLGMTDSKPRLIFKSYENNCIQGEYDRKKDIIYINEILLDESSGYPAVYTFLHEIYHRYQIYLTKLLKSLGNEYQNLMLFEGISEYAEQVSDYIHPDGSFSSYLEYYNQSLEADARSYAYDGVRTYINAVENSIY